MEGFVFYLKITQIIFAVVNYFLLVIYMYQSQPFPLSLSLSVNIITVSFISIIVQNHWNQSRILRPVVSSFIITVENGYITK